MEYACKHTLERRSKVFRTDVLSKQMGEGGG